MTAPYLVDAAVEAVREFLEDGTHGGSGSPAATYNDAMVAARTAWGITTAEMPDIAVYETWVHRGSQATAYPYTSIVPVRRASEDGVNGRMFDVDIDVTTIVPDFQIAGDDQAVMQAAWRYADVLQRLFLRRTKQEQGWTLNNGGTGDAQGRAIRASVTDQAVGSDGGLAVPNSAIVTRVTVRMNESF